MNVWHPDDDRAPRLGLQVGVDGKLMPIPLGAIIYIDLKPGDTTQMVPMVLVEITKNNLKFRHYCGKEDCTLLFNYPRKMTGLCPRSEQEKEALRDLRERGARRVKK